MKISLLELRRLQMFKKIFAIATLVGVALFASVSGASAHQNGYKKHYHGRRDCPPKRHHVHHVHF